MCVFACVCICSNNGSEQLCDCEAELSSNRTPECVIKVIVGPLRVHKNYTRLLRRSTFNEQLGLNISGRVITKVIYVVIRGSPKYHFSEVVHQQTFIKLLYQRGALNSPK